MVPSEVSKLQFYTSFWRSAFMSCEKVASDVSRLQFYSNFQHFRFNFKNHTFTQAFAVRSTFISREMVASEISKLQFHTSVWHRPSFRKGRRQAHKIRLSPHVCASNTHDLRRGCRLKREVEKSLRSRSFVGIQLQVDHLEVNSCVTTPVQQLLQKNFCVTTPV